MKKLTAALPANNAALGTFIGILKSKLLKSSHKSALKV